MPFGMLQCFCYLPAWGITLEDNSSLFHHNTPSDDAEGKADQRKDG